MTKRILALLMTSIMMLSVVPMSPISEFFSIEAIAADTSELQKVYDTVPPKSEWSKYIDTDVLSAYYDLATHLLSSGGDQTAVKLFDEAITVTPFGEYFFTVTRPDCETVATVSSELCHFIGSAASVGVRIAVS